MTLGSVSGSGSEAADAALTAALEHPAVFGRVAGQSSSLPAAGLEEKLAPGADHQPLVIYLEWGTYHMRSPHEAWDLAVNQRQLWAALRYAGYRPAGGEVSEGRRCSRLRGPRPSDPSDRAHGDRDRRTPVTKEASFEHLGTPPLEPNSIAGQNRR